MASSGTLSVVQPGQRDQFGDQAAQPVRRCRILLPNRRTWCGSAAASNTASAESLNRHSQAVLLGLMIRLPALTSFIPRHRGGDPTKETGACSMQGCSPSALPILVVRFTCGPATGGHPGHRPCRRHRHARRRPGGLRATFVCLPVTCDRGRRHYPVPPPAAARQPRTARVTQVLNPSCISTVTRNSGITTQIWSLSSASPRPPRAASPSWSMASACSVPLRVIPVGGC
jgi:hypothetical protein